MSRSECLFHKECKYPRGSKSFACVHPGAIKNKGFLTEKDVKGNSVAPLCDRPCVYVDRCTFYSPISELDSIVFGGLENE